MNPIVLGLGAIALWARDTAWQSVPGDALPVLAGLPLLWYLGQPWQLREAVPEKGMSVPLLLGLALFAVGMLLGLSFVGAMGWTLLLWCYLKPRLDTAARSRVLVLLPLAVLAFPWMISEGQPIGWWFRLTGATVTATVFHLIGFSVGQQGTLLTIEGMPVSIEAACSGLNVLQSLLLVGMVLAVKSGQLRTPQRLPLILLLLGMLAWVANTLRIILICGLGLSFGIATAQSPLLHEGSGLLIVCVIFALWRFRSGEAQPRPVEEVVVP